MAITPLYTSAELDALIAALKQAELALASGTVDEYSIEIAGSSRKTVYRDPAKVRAALQYYQAQRVALSGGSGPQTLVGRPVR